MPATARQLEITQEEIDSSGGQGGAYAALETGDYEALLTDVKDYDNSDKGGSHGWIWVFDVEGLEFQVWTAFSKASRWKLIEVVESFDPDAVEAGVQNIDPNAYVGMTAGVNVNWQTDPDKLAEGEKNYKEIKYVFPLTDVPDEGQPAAEEPDPL